MLDLSLTGSTHTNCSGIARRDFLRIGGIGAMTLPALLQAEARAKEAAPKLTLRRGARAKSVILVYLGGGLSHHDSFDMKPEMPEEIRGKYKPIPTSVDGLSICEKLPILAKAMNKLARCVPVRTRTITTKPLRTG